MYKPVYRTVSVQLPSGGEIVVNCDLLGSYGMLLAQCLEGQGTVINGPEELQPDDSELQQARPSKRQKRDDDDDDAGETKERPIVLD